MADEHKNPEIKTIYKAGGKHVRVSGSGMSGVADAAAPAYKKPAHIKKDARLEDAGLVESGLGELDGKLEISNSVDAKPSANAPAIAAALSSAPAAVQDVSVPAATVSAVADSAKPQSAEPQPVDSQSADVTLKLDASEILAAQNLGDMGDGVPPVPVVGGLPDFVAKLAARDSEDIRDIRNGSVRKAVAVKSPETSYSIPDPHEVVKRAEQAASRAAREAEAELGSGESDDASYEKKPGSQLESVPKHVKLNGPAPKRKVVDEKPKHSKSKQAKQRTKELNDNLAAAFAAQANQESAKPGTSGAAGISSQVGTAGKSGGMMSAGVSSSPSASTRNPGSRDARKASTAEYVSANASRMHAADSSTGFEDATSASADAPTAMSTASSESAGIYAKRSRNVEKSAGSSIEYSVDLSDDDAWYEIPQFDTWADMQWQNPDGTPREAAPLKSELDGGVGKAGDAVDSSADMGSTRASAARMNTSRGTSNRAARSVEAAGIAGTTGVAETVGAAEAARTTGIAGTTGVAGDSAAVSQAHLREASKKRGAYENTRSGMHIENDATSADAGEAAVADDDENSHSPLITFEKKRKFPFSRKGSDAAGEGVAGTAADESGASREGSSKLSNKPTEKYSATSRKGRQLRASKKATAAANKVSAGAGSGSDAFGIPVSAGKSKIGTSEAAPVVSSAPSKVVTAANGVKMVLIPGKAGNDSAAGADGAVNAGVADTDGGKHKTAYDMSTRARNSRSRKGSRSKGADKSGSNDVAASAKAVKASFSAKVKARANARAEANAKRPKIIGNLTSRGVAAIVVLATVVAIGTMVYPTARDYYIASRELERNNVELAQVQERNDAIQNGIEMMSTDEGIEDYARSEFGWTKDGETSVVVKGLPESTSSSTIPAAVDSRNVKVADTWQNDVLDFVFMVNDD